MFLYLSDDARTRIIHVTGKDERDERQTTHVCSSTSHRADHFLPREIEQYASAKWPYNIDKRLPEGSPEVLPTDILFRREMI